MGMEWWSGDHPDIQISPCVTISYRFPLHFISIPHCRHSEIAAISEIRQENMVLIYGLDSCLSLLIFFHRDHRVEQLVGYSRSEGCVMFTVYHGGRLLVNLWYLSSHDLNLEKKQALTYIDELSDERRFQEILRLVSSAYFGQSVLLTVGSDYRDCCESV